MCQGCRNKEDMAAEKRHREEENTMVNAIANAKVVAARETRVKIEAAKVEARAKIEAARAEARAQIETDKMEARAKIEADEMEVRAKVQATHAEVLRVKEDAQHWTQTKRRADESYRDTKRKCEAAAHVADLNSGFPTGMAKTLMFTTQLAVVTVGSFAAAAAAIDSPLEAAARVSATLASMVSLDAADAALGIDTERACETRAQKAFRFTLMQQGMSNAHYNNREAFMQHRRALREG